MSQEGIIDVVGSHPEIPTLFIANVGFAIPIANTLEILGAFVSAASIPVETVGSGNTITVNVQASSAHAAPDSLNAGLASFDSADFSVDANGFVSLSGSSTTEINVDAHTAPGTDPVVPLAGVITMTGAQVASGVIGANVIRTDSLAANTLTIEIQRTAAVAATDLTKNGVSHFDSAAFDVDANGFVQLNGGGIATTAFDVQANTAPGTDPVVPTAAGVVTVNGAAVANHSVVLETRSRAANAYNLEVQYATSAAATDATKSGVAHFNSTQFSVDANGFVALAGAGEAIDSIAVQTGTSPIAPTVAGLVTINGAVVSAGTNPVRSDGTDANTMAIEVQISQAIASTDATKIGLCNFSSSQFAVDANGFVTLLGGTEAIDSFSPDSGTDPVVPTAAGLVNMKGSGSVTTVGSLNTLTTQLTGLTNHAVLVGAGTTTITKLAVGSNGQVLIGATTADPAFATLTSSDSSISFTTGANTLSLQVAGGTTVLKTLTGDTGGALSPTAGNINTLGSGSITIAGSGSTLTTQLTGLTNHAVLVGAGTTTITKLAVGSTGQVLAGNTGADPSFQSISVTGAFTQVVVQVFSASGAFTYTPTSGMKYCTVEVVGGGGGSGGCATTGGTQTNASGGGGGGGYARKTFSAATIGASKAGSVGAGGLAGTAGANTGGTGGTTSLGSTLLQATGGVGGGPGTTSGTGTGQGAAGGAGGVGTLGDFNTSGTPGHFGFSLGTPPFAAGGCGGSTFFGGGANGVPGITAALAGSTYGGGAAGGGIGTGTTQIAGAAGAIGVCIITEYVSA